MKFNIPLIGSVTVFCSKESSPHSVSKSKDVIKPRTVEDLERELAEAKTINEVHERINIKLVNEITEIKQRAKAYVAEQLKPVAEIEAWLEDRCGADPDRIRVRTRESLMNYCDLLPLMKMVKGRWGELAARIEAEEANRQKVYKDFTNPVEDENYAGKD